MKWVVFANEGLRMFKRSIKVKVKGVKKYQGDANEICNQILNDCWNGKYLQVSNGHFCEFYARDFGWIVNSLLKLKKQDWVHKTLSYAMECYEKKGAITTTINPKGTCFDFPTYAPDSLNFMLYSLRTAKAKNIVKHHCNFLNQEIQRCYDLTVDKETGLIRRGVHFSSMKDHAVNDSSCYNNVMIGRIQENAKLLHLDNPFKTNFKKEIKRKFWTGEYFLDDLSGATHVAGDANLFPFWTDLFTNKNMMKKAFTSVERAHLTAPWPLRYTSKNSKHQEKMIFIEAFAGAYERDTVWMHMGPLYIEMLAKINKQKAKQHLTQLKEIIERDGNYLELYWKTKKPFSSPFYYADESMSWCANYLTLARKLHV